MNLDPAGLGWQKLGDVEPGKLTGTRLDLHYAAQAVGAAGRHLAEPHEDDSHTSLDWEGGAKTLVGQPLNGQGRPRVGLSFADYSLFVAGGPEGERDSLPLKLQNLEGVMAWLAKEATHRGMPGSNISSKFPYQMPAHVIDRGEPFIPGPLAQREELAAYFSNTAGLLEGLRRAEEGVGPVKVWPHHFDIAALAELETPDGESQRSIGVGLSPGDEHYDMPYWYLLPWPKPDPAKLPEWQGPGGWHTKDWVGAVLPSSEVVAEESATGQAKMVAEFIRQGWQASS